jgi:hypothetical protein
MRTGTKQAVYGDAGASGGTIPMVSPVMANRSGGGGGGSGIWQGSPSGRDAVVRSKKVAEMKSMVIAHDEADKDSAIKSAGDKTFYLRDGFWTDSTFDPRGMKPQVITFGSTEYFNLVRNNAGISKYLAIGKQVILVLKGHSYKIVGPTTG